MTKLIVKVLDSFLPQKLAMKKWFYILNNLIKVCFTHLFNVGFTSFNKLLRPAIDPEDPSLERIVEGMDEVN